MPGALFQGEKLPGYRPGLAHVQPFVTTKTTRRNSAQTLRDSCCSLLCLAHGRFEDPSNLAFKLIIALI